MATLLSPLSGGIQKGRHQWQPFSFYGSATHWQTPVTIGLPPDYTLGILLNVNSSPTTNAPSSILRSAPSAARREKITPRIAAQRASLSIWDIYRLWNGGYIEGERPTPHKILIYADSLTAHLEATRDPAFWETHQLAS